MVLKFEEKVKLCERYKELEERIKLLNEELRTLQKEKKEIEETFLNEGIQEENLGTFKIVRKEKEYFIPDKRKVYNAFGWEGFLKVVKVQVGELKKVAKLCDIPVNELGHYEHKPYIKIFKAG